MMRSSTILGTCFIIVSSCFLVAESVAPTHGPGQAADVSFVATKSLPTDAYKMRNSVFLTAPMRSPPQAAVNVIMREDVSGMQERSKYRGMESQIRRLRRQFAEGVSELRDGV